MPVPPMSPPPPAAGRRSLHQVAAAPAATFPSTLLQNISTALQLDLNVRPGNGFLFLAPPRLVNITRVNALTGAATLEPGWSIDFSLAGFGFNEAVAGAYFSAITAVQAAPGSAAGLARALSAYSPAASVAGADPPLTNVDFRSAWLTFNTAGAAAQAASTGPGFAAALQQALPAFGVPVMGNITLQSPFPQPAPPMPGLVREAAPPPPVPLWAHAINPFRYLAAVSPLHLSAHTSPFHVFTIAPLLTAPSPAPPINTPSLPNPADCHSVR